MQKRISDGRLRLLKGAPGPNQGAAGKADSVDESAGVDVLAALVIREREQAMGALLARGHFEQGTDRAPDDAARHQQKCFLDTALLT